MSSPQYESQISDRFIIFIFNCVLTIRSTRWSKSHAIHIKIYKIGCNLIQFGWTNRVSLWLYTSPHRSRHVVGCTRQSVSCLQQSKPKISFAHVQRVFIVEVYLLPRSYLACQNVLGYISRFFCAKPNDSLSFREAESVQDRNRFGRPSLLRCTKHEEKSEYRCL